MWFDLEEDYWKAGTTLTCFSIIEFADVCEYGRKIYVERYMDNSELLKENTATHSLVATLQHQVKEKGTNRQCINIRTCKYYFIL